MEKKHKKLAGNFCPGVQIMHSNRSCSARSKYHLTIKNLVCTHFYGPPDSGGLAVRGMSTNEILSFYDSKKYNFLLITLSGQSTTE